MVERIQSTKNMDNPLRIITKPHRQKKVVQNVFRFPVKRQVSKPMCRICYQLDFASNMLSPCNCQGSIAYIHPKCLAKWMQIKQINSCEICNEEFLSDNDGSENSDQIQNVQYSACESPMNQYINNNLVQVSVIFFLNILIFALSFASYSIFLNLEKSVNFYAYFFMLIAMLILLDFSWIEMRLQSSTQNTYVSIKGNFQSLIQKPSISKKQEKKRKQYMQRIRRCIRMYRRKNIGNCMFDEQDSAPQIDSQNQQ